MHSVQLVPGLSSSSDANQTSRNLSHVWRSWVVIRSDIWGITWAQLLVWLSKFACNGQMKLEASCWFLNMLQRHAEGIFWFVTSYVMKWAAFLARPMYSLALFLISCSFYFRRLTATTVRQGTWPHTSLPQYHIAASKSESIDFRF